MEAKVIKKRNLILYDNLWKAVIFLAAPVAINGFVRAMYNLIDTLFVASIGSMEIAAITFVGPINMFVSTISLGLAIGGTNLVAREIGRENYEKAKSVSLQVLTIAALFGVIISGISFTFSREILEAASATEGIIEAANIYFKLTVLSSPFVFINSAYIAIKNADGETVKSMNINLFAMGIKAVLTYIMIFHLGMGIQSLAISTIVGTVIVTVYGLYDLFIRPSFMKLSVKDLKFNKQILWALFIISLPIMIEKSSVSFSFIILNKYVISYGEEVIAGYGITNRINSLFFAMVTGLGTGLSPIISQNLGAKNAQRAKSAVWKTLVIALGVSIGLLLILLPNKEYIANFFAKGNQAVLYHTVNAMSVYSASIIPWAFFQVASGVFQGTGHTKYNLIISLVRIYMFRLPLVIIFTEFTNLSEYSIWYGMLISNILTGIFATVLYLKHSKELSLSGE